MRSSKQSTATPPLDLAVCTEATQRALYDAVVTVALPLLEAARSGWLSMECDRTLARRVGAALKHFRQQRDLARYMLADLAGITKPMLAAYEAGRQCPSLLTLIKLLAALGCSWQEFGRVLQAPEAPEDAA
jgi:DNA-binding XRE family transcriptional regulator